jgi:hypothetical protein
MTGVSPWNRLRRTAQAVCAFAALAAFLLPATASAKTPLRLPASINETVHLRGSHGYRIELSLTDHRRLYLLVRRGSPRRGEQTVIYTTTTSRSTGTDIDASIGRLGRIDVRFIARSRTHKPNEGECVGSGTTAERGRFVGQIAFRGERGYTQVKVRQAPGEVIREGAQACPESKRVRDDAWRDPLQRRAVGRPLRLFAGTRSGTFAFEAGRIEDPRRYEPSGAYFIAYSRRSVDGVNVASDAAVYPTSARGFTPTDPSRPAAEATVQPPGPFSGSATFRLESPSSASWTGDLAVELPNLGTVQLTGPDTYSGFCEARHCTDTLPQGVAGSG